MSWIAISSIAYFLNSIAVLVNKILLRRIDKHPVVYAFYVNILGAVILPLIFFFPLPSSDVLAISLISGALFTLAIFTFFWLLRRGEASRIAPLVGALQPVAILFLAWIFLGEVITMTQLAAFALILAGSWLINQEDAITGKRSAVNWQMPLFGLLAALLFALSFVGTKYVYTVYGFWGGLSWRTLGSVGMALFFLLPRESRREILHARRHAQDSAGALFIGGQIAGGLSFVLVNYAFTLGSTALVNALSGVQYVFLFLLALLFSERYPHLLREHTDPRTIVQKTVSLALIIFGALILALG